MHLQLDKFSIDNEEKLSMVWASSLWFSCLYNNIAIKCCNWPTVIGSDLMDLQKISPILIMKKGLQCFEEAP